jgi:hypothetical protein
MCMTNSRGEGQVHWEKRPIGSPSSCRCLSKFKNYFAYYFDVFMKEIPLLRIFTSEYLSISYSGLLIICILVSKEVLIEYRVANTT